MASEVTVLHLSGHCRCRVQLLLEDQFGELPMGFNDSSPARMTADPVDVELFEHMERVAELPHEPGGDRDEV